MKNILPGKIKTIELNNHKVRVIAPKKLVGYEEGVRDINRMLKRIVK